MKVSPISFINKDSDHLYEFLKENIINMIQEGTLQNLDNTTINDVVEYTIYDDYMWQNFNESFMMVLQDYEKDKGITIINPIEYHIHDLDVIEFKNIPDHNITD